MKVLMMDWDVRVGSDVPGISLELEVGGIGRMHLCIVATVQNRLESAGINMKAVPLCGSNRRRLKGRQQRRQSLGPDVFRSGNPCQLL